MPTLTVTLAQPLTAEARQPLARALTAVTAETLQKDAAVTAVVFRSADAGGWWIGGEAPTRPTAMLEIRITAGTNDDAQKARFVQAAHAALQQHLAPDDGTLERATYVVVHELPAGDWGYGGLTQQARRRAR